MQGVGSSAHSKPNITQTHHGLRCGALQLGIQLEAEARGEADRPQHPQRVCANTHSR